MHRSSCIAHLAEGCVAIRKITVPDGVAEIDYRTFKGCTALESAEIGDGVHAIRGGAFEGCTNLKKVGLGSGMELLGNGVFYDCPSLAEISVAAPVPPTTLFTFDDRDLGGIALWVPEGSVEAYENDATWQDFGIIKGKDFASADSIVDDGDTMLDVFTVGGLKVGSDERSTVLDNLEEGVYIIKSKGITRKYIRK